MNTKLKLTFFKETGKYYTEEYIDIPGVNTMMVHDITAYLEQHCRSYPGMYLVAMLDELEYGYPIMIPAEKRDYKKYVF